MSRRMKGLQHLVKRGRSPCKAGGSAAGLSPPASPPGVSLEERKDPLGQAFLTLASLPRFSTHSQAQTPLLFTVLCTNSFCAWPHGSASTPSHCTVLPSAVQNPIKSAQQTNPSLVFWIGAPEHLAACGHISNLCRATQGSAALGALRTARTVLEAWLATRAILHLLNATPQKQFGP